MSKADLVAAPVTHALGERRAVAGTLAEGLQQCGAGVQECFHGPIITHFGGNSDDDAASAPMAGLVGIAGVLVWGGALPRRIVVRR